MNRFIFLRTIVALSLAAVVILPAYITLFIEPSFIDFITESTEREAAKVGSHMTSTFFSEADKLSRETLPRDIDTHISSLQMEFHVIKVKVFTPDGEIIFSTDAQDIGDINTKEYFHNRVAKGQLFTKVVKKNRTSLEGQTMPVDVVETYVPVMTGGNFKGAFEIYYDITDSKKRLSALLMRSRIISISISICLLIAVLVIARQAKKSLMRQQEAETALHKANDELELRVMKRTSELKDLNKALSQEVLVRKQAEEDKEQLISELQAALAQVKTLSGLLPICSSCQQIRDDKGQWNKLQDYIQDNSEAEFTHGICPNCAKKLYPDLYNNLDVSK